MVNRALNILVIEDSPTDADLLVRSLSSGLSEPFECTVVDTLDEGTATIRRHHIGLIITDLNLPDSSGLSTFRSLQKHAGDTPIVILSGLEDQEFAAKSVRLGAQDYIVKGVVDPQSLARSVRFALERDLRIQAERQRDNATRDLQVAHELQRSLYPTSGPDVVGFDIAGAAYSADQVCGDYYDFVPIPGDRWGIALGDVCGHGLPAALQMFQLRTSLRLLAQQGATPGKVLSGVNMSITHEDEAQRRFASLFFAQLDPRARTLAFASAGHQGYLFRENDDTTVLTASCPVLGVLDLLDEPKTRTIPLKQGDVVFVPTDGFHEAMSPDREMFGVSGMLDVVHQNSKNQSSTIIADLFHSVRDFVGGSSIADDMTATVIKCL